MDGSNDVEGAELTFVDAFEEIEIAFDKEENDVVVDGIDGIEEDTVDSVTLTASVAAVGMIDPAANVDAP